MSNLGQFYGHGFPVNAGLNIPYQSSVYTANDGSEWIGNNACSAFAYTSAYSHLPESLTSPHSIFNGPEEDGSWFPYYTYCNVCYNKTGNVFVTGQYTGSTINSSGGIGYRSTNGGTSWSRFSFPNGDKTYRVVQYAGNLFVGVADSSLTNGIITSPDGVTWTSVTVAGGGTTIGTPGDVASNGSTYYVAHGYADQAYYYSTDSGVTWSSGTAPYAFKNLWVIGQGTIIWCPSASVFMATTTTPGVYMTSPTGATWTANTTNINFARNSMRADGGGQQKIAASSSIIVCAGYGGNYTTSTDGITWSAPALISPDNSLILLLHQFYYDGTRFVARFQNRIFYSTNGTTWTEGKKIGGFTLIIPQSNGVLFGFQLLSTSVVTKCLRIEDPTKTTPATVISSTLGVTVFPNQTHWRIR